jgi:hypothetical protein
MDWLVYQPLLIFMVPVFLPGHADLQHVVPAVLSGVCWSTLSLLLVYLFSNGLPGLC